MKKPINYCNYSKYSYDLINQTWSPHHDKSWLLDYKSLRTPQS